MGLRQKAESGEEEEEEEEEGDEEEEDDDDEKQAEREKTGRWKVGVWERNK
jgi:hypothetical protein